MGFLSNILGGTEGSPSTSRTDPFQTTGGLFQGGFQGGNLNLTQDPRLTGLQGQGLDQAALFGGQVAPVPAPVSAN